MLRISCGGNIITPPSWVVAIRTFGSNHLTASTRRHLPNARAYAAKVAASSPVGYWRLDEPTGSTAADSSGNGYNGTYQSGTSQAAHGAFWPDGNFAVSRATNGNAVVVSHASVWNTTLTGAFTLECWAKLDVIENVYAAQLIRKGTVGNNDALGLYLSGSAAPAVGPARPAQIHLWAGLNQTGGGSAWTLLTNYSATITLGIWHHVAATYSSTAGGTIYLDGVTTNTVAPQQAGTLNIVNTGDVEFGNLQATGALDEVAIYNTILSAATILDHAKARLIQS